MQVRYFSFKLCILCKSLKKIMYSTQKKTKDLLHYQLLTFLQFCALLKRPHNRSCQLNCCVWSWPRSLCYAQITMFWVFSIRTLNQLSTSDRHLLLVLLRNRVKKNLTTWICLLQCSKNCYTYCNYNCFKGVVLEVLNMGRIHWELKLPVLHFAHSFQLLI